MNTGIIKGFTIRTTPNGENVYSSILLNGGGIPVNQHRLPITEDLFGPYESEIINRNGFDQTFLKDLKRNFLPKAFPIFLDWVEEILHPNGQWIPDKNYHEPITTMVLLKAKCKTNLRCPMSYNYWRKWMEAGNMRNDQTTILKEQLREEYPRDYDISNSGAFMVLPDKDSNDRLLKDQRDYLILMANNSSVEWVFDRTDGRPNTYRVECKDGDILLIDPRREITMMMKEEDDARDRNDY